jgi:hypothetical protein
VTWGRPSDGFFGGLSDDVIELPAPNGAADPAWVVLLGVADKARRVAIQVDGGGAEIRLVRQGETVQTYQIPAGGSPRPIGVPRFHAVEARRPLPMAAVASSVLVWRP